MMLTVRYSLRVLECRHQALPECRQMNTEGRHQQASVPLLYLFVVEEVEHRRPLLAIAYACEPENRDLAHTPAFLHGI